MLLNISTDRIIFMNAEERIVLPYGDLEKNVSEFLYSSAFAEVKGQLVVVNGPGSFTNLRIVTLALNTYNMLHEFPINFVSVSKIDRYKTAFVSQKVKRYCLMYIGQKKNFWIVDLSIKNEEGGIKNDGIVKVHVDHIEEYITRLGDDWFVDEIVAEGKEMIDSLLGDSKYEIYKFKDIYTVQADEQCTKLLEPNYMIEANVS